MGFKCAPGDPHTQIRPTPEFFGLQKGSTKTKAALVRQVPFQRIYSTATVEWDGSIPPHLPTKGTEEWRVGFVQNVLYDFVRVTYYDVPAQPPEYKSESPPYLDADDAVPFFAGPDTPITLTGPNGEIDILSASADVRLTSDGAAVREGKRWRSLSDGFSSSRINLGMTDSPIVAVYEDLGGHLLQSIEVVVSFRQWIVALRASDKKVLPAIATGRACTIVGWMKIEKNFTKGELQLRRKFTSGTYILSDRIFMTKQPPPLGKSVDDPGVGKLEKSLPKAPTPVPPPTIQGILANSPLKAWGVKAGIIDPSDPMK